MFYINAGVYAAGLLAFLLMAEGETQDWVLPYIKPLDQHDAKAIEAQATAGLDEKCKKQKQMVTIIRRTDILAL